MKTRKTKNQALRHDFENDYTMTGPSFWVTVGTKQLYVRHLFGRLSVECFPHEAPNDALGDPIEEFCVDCD